MTSEPTEYHYIKPEEFSELSQGIATVLATAADVYLSEAAERLRDTALDKWVKPIQFSSKFLGPGGVAKDVLVELVYARNPESPELTGVILEKIITNGVAVATATTGVLAASPTIVNYIRAGLGLATISTPQSALVAFSVGLATTIIWDKGIKFYVNNAIDVLNMNYYWDVEFQAGDRKGGLRYSDFYIDARTEVQRLGAEVLKQPALWGIATAADADGAHISISKTTPTMNGPQTEYQEGRTILGNRFFERLGSGLFSTTISRPPRGRVLP